MGIKKIINYFKKQNRFEAKGFTMLEILLVVAMIAILAGIVIFAINPGKQLADARNAQRRADVNTIMNAIYQYAIDNNGIVPPTITSEPVEICLDGNGDCSGLINLGVLTENQKYLPAMPRDPGGLCGSNSTCYHVIRSSNNRITVSAQYAEQGAVISITR